ncbi:unnamed protein product [Soboliphyme baturini]|uniref:6PF2K domain-containing protein n=1 Tax=Soboliphyme baturini TaxID=241478 RepID=A0A183IV74_9BILA|nr:unnamed protein product [Soboliphyme baturini]
MCPVYSSANPDIVSCFTQTSVDRSEKEDDVFDDDDTKLPLNVVVQGKRRTTYSTIKACPFIAPSACQHLVKLPSVIIMVGLPARGKTYIAKKLCRYLNWTGIITRVQAPGVYLNIHTNQRGPKYNKFYNIVGDMDVKVNSPDYKNMDKEIAKVDFQRRIEHYRTVYQPVDSVFDKDVSFIKVFDAGKRFLVQHIMGHVQSRVVYFLMNIHLMPRSIFLTRVRSCLIYFCTLSCFLCARMCIHV